LLDPPRPAVLAMPQTTPKKTQKTTTQKRHQASQFLERLNDAISAAHLVVDTANAVAGVR